MTRLAPTYPTVEQNDKKRAVTKIKSAGKKRRAQPKEVRREQLIQATINCIARTGLSGVTMARVTSEAGLSLGIANLHFETKDKLLLETLKYVSDEYNRGQQAILIEQTFPSLSAQMDALLAFDFSRAVTDKNKAAVWYAFLGEAKSRPTYQHICSRQDSIAEAALTALFQAVIEEGEYQGADAALLASGYISLVDGLCLNSLVSPRRLPRSKALKTARHCLASAFPKHIKLE